MNYWLIRYRTESGVIRVVRVLAGQRLDAWTCCIRHEWYHSKDMPIELLKIRNDGIPNLAKGAYIYELIETEKA